MDKCKGQPRIDTFVKSERPIPKSELQIILDNQVSFTTSTLSSFRINNNPAFIELADSLIAIGSKYGNVQATNVLYCKESVRTCTYNKAKKFGDDLRRMLISSNVVKNDTFCLTSDIWTEQSTNSSYLQTHVQWLDENFQLNNSVLEMEYFPEKHTGINIQEKLNLVIQSLGAEPSKTTIITDCGANMLSAVRNMNSIACACHRLSTSIETGWKKAILMNEELRLLNDSVNKVITSVNHKTDLQANFIRKIQQSSQTRAWRGLFSKFSQISVNYQILVEMSRTEKKLLNIIQIDYDKLNNVLDFLKKPNDAFDIFEQESVASINRVAPLYYELQYEFSKPAENEIIKTLNMCFKEAFEAKFFTMLAPIHYAGTLLTPHYRKFSYIPNYHDRAIALNEAKDYIRNLFEPEDLIDVTLPPFPKKSKSAFGEDTDEEELLSAMNWTNISQ